MMKHIRFLILLLLAICLTPHAVADETLSFEPSGDYVQSICWQGDTLYMLGRETLYRWRPGDAEAQPFWQAEGIEMMRYMDIAPEDENELSLWRQAVSYIVPGKDAPLALQPYSGDVYSIGADGLAPVAAIPTERLTFTMDDQLMFRDISGTAGRDGILWLLLGTDDMMDWSKQTVLRFDTADGSIATFDVTGVMSIAAADEGALLLAADMGWDTCEAYRLVDGTTGEVIREYEGGGATAIWAQGDVLEYRGGELVQVNGAGMRTVRGYVPASSQLWGGMACSDGGLCAVRVGSYVLVRDLNNPTDKTVLKVAGTLDQSDLIHFTLENPDVAVVVLNESVQQAALTGGADMFVVSAPGMYGTLAGHRGLAPIADDALAGEASAFYDSIREAIAPEGQLLAWPISMMTENWSLNETVWAQFDLGEAPATFTALMETLGRWQDDYADEEPDYMLAELPGSLAGCLQLMMREYILQCGDEYPDFSSEAFRQAARTMVAHQAAIERNAESGWMPLLYSYSAGFGITYFDSDRIRMIPRPAIADGDERKVAATLTLLTVSSASQQQDAALRLIRWYAGNMSATLRYMLDPSQNAPLRRDNYETRLAELNAQKDAVAADGQQEQLEQLEQRIADWENEDGWLISADSIANYREAAANLVVPYRSPLLQSEGGMAALDERIELACAQGLTEANLDRLLSELTSVAQMVMEENQ